MAKKKPVAQAPATIEIAATLQRDEQGFGALPGVQHNVGLMAITPAQGEATIAQLATQGFAAKVVTLRELAAAGDDNAAAALAELAKDDTCAVWDPQPPAGEGWILVAVLYHMHKENISNGEVDAVALFARTQAAEDAQPGDASQSDAAAFLVGNLMAAAKRRFTELALPWRQLSEHEQERLLRYLAEDVRMAVGKAIKAIASNQRLTFRAEVESVQFKGASDIKAVLKLMGGPESHALADSAGGFVTVVIEDVEELLSIPEGATKGEADQKPLFDASTERTPEKAFSGAVA